MNASVKKKAATSLAVTDPIHPIRALPAMVHMSLPGIYTAIHAGHLHSFLMGRKRVVRQSAVNEWLAFLESKSNEGKPVVYRPRGGATL